MVYILWPTTTAQLCDNDDNDDSNTQWYQTTKSQLLPTFWRSNTRRGSLDYEGVSSFVISMLRMSTHHFRSVTASRDVLWRHVKHVMSVAALLGLIRVVGVLRGGVSVHQVCVVFFWFF